MTLRRITPACIFGLSLALSGPALAVPSLAYVPSLWPADSAFDGGEPAAVISSKGESDTAAAPEHQDR